MMANIVGEGALEVAIGEAVTVTFERRGDVTLPQFTRVVEDRAGFPGAARA
jgi:hypothetical protein